MSIYTEAQKEAVGKALEMIMENPGRPITITELARILHISPIQLKVSLQKVYGLQKYRDKH